jgi:hypothetical protein
VVVALIALGLLGDLGARLGGAPPGLDRVRLHADPAEPRQLARTRARAVPLAA